MRTLSSCLRLIVLLSASSSRVLLTLSYVSFICGVLRTDASDRHKKVEEAKKQSEREREMGLKGNVGGGL